MKKVLGLLLVALVFCMPIVALAAPKLSVSIPNDTNNVTDVSDEIVQKAYPIMITKSNDEDNSAVKEIKIGFTFGAAITKQECQGSNGWEATYTKTADNAGQCVFTSQEGTNSEEFQVGTIVIQVKKNAPDQECVIKYSFEGASATFNNPNPQTGASLPLQIVLGGLVLAAGAYTVSKKRNRLYSL